MHEPVRLAILTVLTSVQEADFNFLITALGISKGNLASHMARLEEPGYVAVRKEFVGRIPRTTYKATAQGRAAYKRYWEAMRTLHPAAAEPKIPLQARPVEPPGREETPPAAGRRRPKPAAKRSVPNSA